MSDPSRPSRDPSIDNEPHLRGGGFAGDPSEAKAAHFPGGKKPSVDEQVEHSVWDEPALSPRLAGAVPDNALTYAAWLEQRLAETTGLHSWTATLVVALLAGPWAILGALLANSGGEAGFGVMLVTVFGPVFEEMAKVAVPLWVVEKRPYWFRSPMQIALCAVVGGLVFAAVENVLYLFVYIPNPTDGLIHWRWTVCLALHGACSYIAGLGLISVWRRVIEERSMPELKWATPYFVTAIVIHGTYNGFAVLLDVFEFNF